MTTIDTTRPAAMSGLRGFFASVAGTFADWNDARQTRNALSRLSQHELEDIGLCRGDIETIATRHIR